MKANKQMVQQHLSLETGNVILLKDLSNIMTANKQGKSRNDVDATRDNKYETGIGNCCTCSMYNHVSDVTKRQTPWSHAFYNMADFQ